MSPTVDGIEREVKLEVDDRFIVPAFGADGRLVVDGLDPRRLDATYYDTADLRLLSLGITARRRTGEGTRWTVKFPTAQLAAAGGLARLEVDVVTEQKSPPAEVVALLSPHLAGGDLMAVARLVSARERLRLSTRDGTLLAEVDDDRVAVYGADSAGPPGGEDASFREVEVEFEADADPALIGVVVDQIVAAGARRSAGRSKVEHALDLLGQSVGGVDEQ